MTNPTLPPLPPITDAFGNAIDTDAIMAGLIAEQDAGLADAIRRSEARAAAEASGLGAAHEDWVATAALEQAREDVISDNWDSLTYTGKLDACRRAQAHTHELEVMRFEVLRAVEPYRAQDHYLHDGDGRRVLDDKGRPRRSVNERGKRYNRFASAAAYAKKRLQRENPARLAYYEEARKAREIAGWGAFGDEAVNKIAPPNTEAWEEMIERHVREGTLPVDTMPGDRGDFAKDLRRQLAIDKAEILRRRRALQQQEKADARETRTLEAKFEQLLAQRDGVSPAKRAELEDLARRVRCTRRYEQSYGERALEDIATMIRLDRPIPQASRHLLAGTLIHRRPRFAHSDRGRI